MRPSPQGNFLSVYPFCTNCKEACPEGAISHAQDFRLATSRREDLLTSSEASALARALGEKSRRLFGRSLRLRQVSAGGRNACEVDVNVLGTVVPADPYVPGCPPHTLTTLDGLLRLRGRIEARP